MASDLTSSKEQINEVKQLLLCLIHPTLPPSPVPVRTFTPTTERQGEPLTAQVIKPTTLPLQDPHYTIPLDIRERRVSSRLNRIEEVHASVTQTATIRHHHEDRSMPIVVHPMVQSPSWGSGETVPITPNSLLQNFTNKMPIGAATSTDISGSFGAMSNKLSPQPATESMPRSPVRCFPVGMSSCGLVGCSFENPSSEGIPEEGDYTKTHNGVTTWGMATQAEKEPEVRAPRPNFKYGPLPRLNENAIAANSLCFVYHVDHGDVIIAQGQAGGS
ncbi:hypothetical protein KC19_VG054500 [Ceratodon purpureus]|uniref:Uncharacterized protein n=1 Tax=Ceratodon purpureus TaxID=3225 RepID=A0A8T0HMR3_CERPU|nr:hypothetical protein KC19_VG054500 [Ceratodon purpureus]